MSKQERSDRQSGKTMIILPSITDRALKNGYSGKVVGIANGKEQVLAIVYGKTLCAVRSRRKAICKALRNLDRKGEL